MSIEVSKLPELVQSTMDSMTESELIVLVLGIHYHIEYSPNNE